jgi:hypothetical protein
VNRTFNVGSKRGFGALKFFDGASLEKMKLLPWIQREKAVCTSLFDEIALSHILRLLFHCKYCESLHKRESIFKATYSTESSFHPSLLFHLSKLLRTASSNAHDRTSHHQRLIDVLIRLIVEVGITSRLQQSV